MHLYYLDEFVEIVEWILMVEETIGKFFERLEEAVEIHLAIITTFYYTLVYYIVVPLNNQVVRHSWVPCQFLELLVRYEIVAPSTSQYLEHLLGIGVDVQVVHRIVFYR